MPPYSPNLNLIERLWKFMRKTILYNKYYEKCADFKIEVMRFFEKISKNNDKLSTLLTKNSRSLVCRKRKLICIGYIIREKKTFLKRSALKNGLILTS